MPNLYFKDAADLLRELYEERDELLREKDKVDAAINGVSQKILDDCEFECGQKVVMTGRHSKKMETDYLFIYSLYVKKNGSVYAKLCEPLKSDGTMPKDTVQKSLDDAYKVSRLGAV